MRKNLILDSYKALKALATRTVEIKCDRLPYMFEKVPLKKLLNWVLVEASIYAKPPKPWGWPTHLQVEPTSHCNLRCALCPVTEGLGRPPGFMDVGLFKRLIDETGGHVFLLLLWDWGEPFLHPDIYEMISYASQRGIKVVTSTNGHRFAHPDHAEKVVRSGLDTLIFAIDGISQETYERYRRDGKLETVLQGIRTVISKKRELNSRAPRVNLRFIVMKYNEHEIPKLKDLAESLGVDVLTLKTLYPGHDCDPEKDRENEFIPNEPRYRRFHYDEHYRRLRVKQNRCKSLWNAPCIHWNGAVCTCSFDAHEKHAFGDLHTAAFKDIWSGEMYRRFRRQFREDWEATSLCGECSYAWVGGNCALDTIPEAVFFTPEVTKVYAGEACPRV